MRVRQELSAREVDEMQQGLMRRLGDSSVPTLPQVAVKIIELMGDQNATINQFADVIKSDQGLTGRLLRLANSALFAQRQPVTQLQRAMVLMGMEKLKAMSLGFHLSKAMVADEGPFSLKRLWTQSLFRSWLALHIAETMDKRVSGEAFIVGLLSDAGTAVMTKLQGDDYAKAVDPTETPSRQYLAEMRSLPFTHLDASVVLCKVWRLPELLARPIGLHHMPAKPASKDDPASILHAVAYYVGTLPLDPEGQTTDESMQPELAEKLFGLRACDMVDLIDRSAATFKATREMFSHVLAADLSVDRIVETANKNAADHESTAHQAKRTEAVGTYRAGGMVFELHRGSDRNVIAVISDEAGNRIVREEIDPHGDNERMIREKLMLESARPEDVLKIMSGIRALAA